MLQPRDWAWAFFTFHGGSLRIRASSPGLVELSEATRAAVRTPSAMASAISTWATPRCSAQRSISIEPARSPTSTRSATVKPVTSAWPWWNRATASASMVPPKSETSWLAAAESCRRSAPTASTSALAASAVIRPPAWRTSLRTKAMRSPDGGTLGHSSIAAPGRPERLDQGLVALAAEVDDHQRQVGVGILRVADQRVGQRAGALLDTGDDHEPVAPEQRGRQHVGQLAHRQAGRGQLVLLGVLVVGEDRRRTAETARARSSSSSPITTRRREVGSTGVADTPPSCHGGTTGPTAGERSGRPGRPSRPTPTPAAASAADRDPPGAARPTTARSPSRSVRWIRIPSRRARRAPRWDAVGVVRPDRDQGDPGPAGGEERRVGVPAAVVGHLQDVGPKVDAVARPAGPRRRRRGRR